MNLWAKRSVELARDRDYLDQLFKVYPMSINPRRELNKSKCAQIETHYNKKENYELIKALLDFDIFPVKDSYIAYLKRDRQSIDRNPRTVDRLAGLLYQHDLEYIYDKCSEPKETNRQIGPLFKNWIDSKPLGAPVFNHAKDFLSHKGDAVYNTGDAEMKDFATEHLGFTRNKGLDFIGRFNETYVIAEAKFLTDFGGHQNAQFDDAISTLRSQLKVNKHGFKVISIAILDGTLYIKGGNKLYRHLEENGDDTIVSALLLSDFVYSL